MKSRKGINIALISMSAAVMLASSSSCRDHTAGTTEATNVKLFTVKSAAATSVAEFPGRVKAAEEVNMAFKVGGTLMHVHVEDGSKVRKGDLIAEIDPRDYQLQFDATDAEYRKIKAEAERVIALYADSVSTADAYDKARYGLQQISAKYENAKNQLSDTKIYAPFDGFVQQRLFDPPAVIAAGMPVVTLISTGRQEIEINIPASTYYGHRNMDVNFSTSFDFIPDKTIPLNLAAIAPKANANQLYNVRLTVPAGLSPQPSPGMNVMVKMTSDDAESHKTAIPSSALFRKGDESCVWVYDDKSGVIERRTVSVERLDTGGNAVITDGLAVGENIVATGVHKLSDGEKVKPMASETETNVGGLL